jgi:hypothetical protein
MNNLTNHLYLYDRDLHFAADMNYVGDTLLRDASAEQAQRFMGINSDLFIIEYLDDETGLWTSLPGNEWLLKSGTVLALPDPETSAYLEAVDRVRVFNAARIVIGNSGKETDETRENLSTIAREKYQAIADYFRLPWLSVHKDCWTGVRFILDNLRHQHS